MDGLLLLDKPTGMTSHDVVAEVRKLLKQKTVGHTGTLDPLATGLLVLVLGDATKLSDYLVSEDKQYELTVKFGMTTDTLDRDGQITWRFQGALPSAEQVQDAAEQLQGEFDWPVPIFSAVKMDGKKLYEFGRQGESVELPIKTMSFWGMEILNQTEDTLTVRLSCSKGSFIRSWASRLGEILGCGGIIQELRRLRVGNWNVDRALALAEVSAPEVSSHGGFTFAARPTAFIPMSQALPGLKSVLASPKEARLVGHGQIPRDIMTRLVYEQKQAYDLGRSVVVKVVSHSGDLLALLAAEPGQGLKIKRVFRTLS